MSTHFRSYLSYDIKITLSRIFVVKKVKIVYETLYINVAMFVYRSLTDATSYDKIFIFKPFMRPKLMHVSVYLSISLSLSLFISLSISLSCQLIVKLERTLNNALKTRTERIENPHKQWQEQ